MIASMEGKIQQLATQLTEQVNLYKELEAKYHRGESHIIELESKLRSLDNEYCATEAIRDNLKSDRVKYLTFLERVGNILKLNQISVDIGLDMNVDLILARIEQLVRMENDSLQDKQTNIYNLQRKVKALKEQLDNKELHLDLLRKKLSALEEERSSKCALEKEIDDHVLMGKKFKAKVEKLTEQLNSLKCENTSLKAQLTDVSCFKGKTSEQEKEISKLLMKISELESIKEKQSSKIAKLRDELDSISSETNKTRHSSETVVQSLSQELRHTKLDLDKTLDREKQVNY
jgi:chromosome segregation ATPase